MKLLTAVAVLAMVGVASANILVPNGNFELGNTGWVEASGGATYSYPASGGNPNGYGQMDGGSWALLIPNGDSPMDVTTLGVVAGTSIEVAVDMNMTAGSTAGLKVESYNSVGGQLNYIELTTTDVKTAGAFDSYTFSYSVPAGTAGMKIMPLTLFGSSAGFDNVGVVPEPATLGLLGITAAAMAFIRRRLI